MNRAVIYCRVSTKEQTHNLSLPTQWKSGNKLGSPELSDSLFERVQIALTRRNGENRHRLDHPGFPLRRFVVSDACGAPLTGSAPRGRSKKYSYYHCRRCRGVSIRVEALNSEFIELLETLKPRQEFMALFRAVVLDVWRKRCQSAVALRSSLETRLSALQRRETQLEDAYVYEQRIDATSYERQRDKLREEVALVRMEIEDARIEEIDVEGLLAYAEHVLMNAAALWRDATSEQRQRLQRAIFPAGLRFRNGTFGTAVTCLAFMRIEPEAGTESGMAYPYA